MGQLCKSTKITLQTYAKLCYTLWLRGIKSDTKSYTKTVLLPQTNFPARLGGKKRVEMDSYLIEKCGFLELYNWQRKNLKGPDFVLHDGPPYANGEPHMGHAINKVLKDITLRNKILTGKRVHYIPGWDCHGLPIEQKVLSNNIKDTNPLEIRRKARKYASDAIAKQRETFISWGIVADWNESGCYFTNHASYIKNQLRQFINLYDKGLVFRAFKPVHWSPSSRTALAESELEYNESHKSKSVIIRMQLDASILPSKLRSLENKPLYALIWTTTPWSLIANQAIAFSDNIVYCIVEDNSKNLYILAQECLTSVEQNLGPLRLITTITGQELSESKYFHPITKKRLPFLPGQHVTTNVGTGLVHTAPAHGPEDFLIAVENNIPVLSLIDVDGCFMGEAGDEFAGLDVLTDGADKILHHIGEDVLHIDTITHSYPYDWRTKKPIIIRVSHQWFIDINSIKEKAIDSIANIKIYPEQNHTSYSNALLAQVKQRPYWCISRQRSWGTPIPILYNKRTDDVYTSRKWVERLCKLTERYGPDYWWELSTEKLIGRELRQELNDIDDLEKGTDIMDIWLDSGLSWSAVLPECKADLYLEGMDQFRGWFQSSLLTSVALQERSPYSALFVHGFAVDDKASKMSKSVGNVVNPEIIIKGGENLNKNPAYGVDTLRWWVASHGCQHSQVPVTTTLLRESHESIQKLRLVLRFLLGALHPSSEGITVEPEYLHLDKYMLHALHQYNKEIQNLYDNYLYHHVCKLVMSFLTNTVSPVYCHLIKDRLYCDEVGSPTRLAVMEVTCETLTVLVRSIAPIVPHLAEEVWLYQPENLSSVPLYHAEYKVPETWHQPELARHVERALSLRSKVNTLADRNTWELSGTLTATTNDYECLSILQKDGESSTSELCDILQLSSITLLESPMANETQIELHNTEKMLCQRCRRHPELDKSGLCNRCVKVLDLTNVSSVSV
ncbi:LOW QUALITY PROTEIN: isoleucine--tRNA ligase, mitochondrial [Nylanderia fulva]|uniref:LOW QUALITY PROTEIN: isoleucine--tRNA ligase, mitochondrial n=1 Tax=Nylanderia fulva TaxID=613905 RepID=UPI0010FB2491|nr:LOW QUALITY PROTEIN: isoleucine--tRNA ligase, mitochondrial [Nylanderia fulva]